MKQSRPMKKKKKERTWAEAATVVLEQCRGRPLGIREIQEKIFDHKLKDIKMNKQAENVLKTMLSHHANMGNCPFYKLKDRTGFYALKKDLPGYVEGDPSSIAESVDMSIIDADEDSNGSGNSSKRSMRRRAPLANDGAGSHGSSPSDDSRQRENENDNVDVKKKTITNKALASAVTRRSNSYAGSALQKARLLSGRRTSSPNIMGLAQSSIRNRSSIRPVQRSRSSNFLQRQLNHNSNGKPRTLPILDLETPSSVLTNTRMKSVINSATFSMLPASYQYQLIQLLPKVDRELDDHGVPRITGTALNNEFFSQAIQDWVTQLSEGEFTRETQARIMQELAKERSRISPWKEKFFEEYYGQKTQVKRSRSRSHDATSNLADLSFEAQVAKFQHLREALHKEQAAADRDANVNITSDSDSELDPDYRSQSENIRASVPKRYPSMPNISDTPANGSEAKPINRRKINKPFKRPMYDTLQGHTQTALVHRKAIPQHRTAPVYRPLVANRASFQIRDEFYHSDTDVSDTGELSDSNSFHQHDDTDEEGESSDGMMNMGDDNLMDAGEDSESDEFEGVRDEMQQNAVVAEHSYTRLPNLKRRRKSSEEAEWRRLRQANVMPVMAKDDSRMPQPSSNTTLVLRPRGNVGQTVQAMNYSEDSSSTSPEQPYKKSCLTQPMFGKILTVSKAETSREERVGVLFGRGMQPSPHGFHGDSVIPRITMTSSLLSSPVTPTTVCTSYSNTSGTGMPEDTEPEPPIMSLTNSVSSSATYGRTSAKLLTNWDTALGNKNLPDNSNRSGNNGPGLASKMQIRPGRNSRKQSSTKSVTDTTVQGGGDAKVPRATAVATVNAKGMDTDSPSNVVTTSTTALRPSAAAATKDNPATSKAPVYSSAGPLVPGSLHVATTAMSQSQQSCHLIKTELTETRSTSPVLMTKSRLLSSPVKSTGSQSPKLTPTLASQLPSVQGVKRTQNSGGSPVKRTRTLAEIKAQMKAKRLAAATASPTGSPVKQAPPTPRLGSNSPAKVAQNIPKTLPQKVPAVTNSGAARALAFASPENQPTAPKVQRSSPVLKSENRSASNVGSEQAAETAALPKDCGETKTDTAELDASGLTFGSKMAEGDAQTSPKLPGKIILKIKSEEGKKYTVKLDTTNKSAKSSVTDSDDEEIVRKRKLSHVISSSGESGDDIMASGDATSGSEATNAEATPIKSVETYSMLHQLAPPSAYTGKVASAIEHHSLLKKTQKSPVFGEPAFEGLSQMPKKGASLGIGTTVEAARPDATVETKNQPFMSIKPVIGFQDIPSCTALASNAPAFIPPSSIISSAQDTQKYRSTSKGKSLVQMQQLARTNRIQSDESEIAESDTEDENDSTVSTTSSAEDSGQSNMRKTGQKEAPPLQNSVNHEEHEDMGSECEGSYSSSSTDDHPIITDCICACKRLVLCKGCGAYTHEECLSSSSLCSLCV